jgi:hypothetical protein
MHGGRQAYIIHYYFLSRIKYFNNFSGNFIVCFQQFMLVMSFLAGDDRQGSAADCPGRGFTPEFFARCVVRVRFRAEKWAAIGGLTGFHESLWRR